MKLKGAPEDLWDEGSPGDTTNTQVLLVAPRKALGLQHYLPKLHLAQSTHLQATSLAHLCSPMHSSTGIPNTAPCFRAGYGPPPSKRLLRLTDSQLCHYGFQPSGLQPSGGRMAAAQRAQRLSGLAPTTSPLEVTQFCSHTSSGVPCRRPQNPGQKLPENLSHRGWAGPGCLLLKQRLTLLN